MNKVALEAPDLMIEKVVGLVDETDRDVGDNVARTRLTKLPKVCVGRIWDAERMMPHGCFSPTAETSALAGSPGSRRAVLQG